MEGLPLTLVRTTVARVHRRSSEAAATSVVVPTRRSVSEVSRILSRPVAVLRLEARSDVLRSFLVIALVVVLLWRSLEIVVRSALVNELSSLHRLMMIPLTIVLLNLSITTLASIIVTVAEVATTAMMTAIKATTMVAAIVAHTSAMAFLETITSIIFEVAVRPLIGPLISRLETIRLLILAILPVSIWHALLGLLIRSHVTSRFASLLLGLEVPSRVATIILALLVLLVAVVVIAIVHVATTATTVLESLLRPIMVAHVSRSAVVIASTAHATSKAAAIHTSITTPVNVRSILVAIARSSGAAVHRSRFSNHRRKFALVFPYSVLLQFSCDSMETVY